MRTFNASSNNTSSKVASNYAPSCSSAKNTVNAIDTVVAVSILLFAIISILLIEDLLLSIIIIAGLIIGTLSMLKKQTINLLSLQH